METTLELLTEGTLIIDEQYMKLEGSDEAILMIGNTGTGKSTLTYFIAGNDSAIISYMEGVEYRIKDCNGKIGESAVVSHTSFPEAVVDSETSTAFFDYPGFIDNRPVCVEIANAYFMINVAQRLHRAKIMIIMEYATISGLKGVFAKMLESVMDFIPNIENLGSGIGMIATKVEKPNFSNAQIISSIITFLNNALNDPEFVKTFKNENNYKTAVFIMNELKGDGRIGIFRAPDNCGPLSAIPIMIENKVSIKEVMLDSVKFTDVKASDFGISLSDKALLEIINIRQALSDSITASLSIISDSVGSFLAQGCNEATSCEQVLQTIEMLNSDPDFVNNYADFNSWSGSLNKDILGNTTAVFFSIPGLDISPNISDALLTSSGHLDSLELVNKKTLQLDKLYEPLKKLHESITRRVPQLAQFLEDEIESILKNFIEAVLTNLFSGQPCDKVGCEILLKNFESIYSNPDFENNYLYPGSWGRLSYQDILGRVVNIRTELVEWDEDELVKLLSYGEFLDRLLPFDTSLVVGVDSWLQNMRSLKTKIHDKINTDFKATVCEHIWKATKVVYTDLLTIQLENMKVLDDIFAVQSLVASLTFRISDYKLAIEYEFLTEAGLTIRTFVEETIKNFNNLDLSNADTEFYKEFNPLSYLSFFEKNEFRTEIKRGELYDWYRTLTVFEASVNNEKVWYNFLVELLSDLSHQNTQIDNVWKFKDWWGTHGAISATDNDVELKLFWSTFQNCPSFTNLYINDAILLLGASQDRLSKFTSLNSLLEMTLTDKLTCFDVNRVRDCKGMFVSLARVISYNGLLADSEVESFFIKAYHTIYIDAVLDGSKYNNGRSNIDVYIISPTWVTMGGSINLNGALGKTEAPKEGIGGADGAPGGAGGNAGNLYGISRYFPNEYPTISLNGGMGGNGQKGQKGTPGANGTALKPLNQFYTYVCHYDFSGWNIPETMGVRLSVDYKPFSCSCAHNPCQNYCYSSGCHVDCIVPGIKGGFGAGVGGNGGRPGYGGYGGKVIFKIVEEDSERTQQGLSGPGGRNGLGGEGGRGGWNGTTLALVNWNCTVHNSGFDNTSQRDPDGSVGRAGGSSLSPTYPTPHNFDFKQLVPFYIDQFKTATQTLQLSKYFKTPLTQFINKLDQLNP